MKKKNAVTVLICITVLAVLLFACSSETDESTTEPASEELEIEETEESETEEEKEESIEYPEISIGEVVTVEDSGEFYVEFTDISHSLKPTYPSNDFDTYTAEDGNVYVDICLVYKSLELERKSAWEHISVTIYDDEIPYKTSLYYEYSDRGSISSAITTRIDPLETIYFHCATEIPQESVYENGEITAVLSIDDVDYLLTIKENGVPMNDNIEIPDIVTGETYLTDDYSFCIEYSDITDTVMPPDPSGYYRYYEADEDKVYVDICIPYTNLTGKSIRSDDLIYGTLTYAGKYQYNAASTMEESDGSSFMYSNLSYVDSLITERIHILFEVSDEIEETDEPLEVELIIFGDKYNYKIR